MSCCNGACLTRPTSGRPQRRGAFRLGKSVFLLQLVRELVKARGWLVVWLGQNGADLVPVAEAWHRLAPALPACIAIDRDPHNLCSDEPSRLCGNSEIKPLILTAGSPADVGLAGISGYRVSIQSWRSPPPTAKEAAEVRTWYERRTGRAPKVPPALPTDQRKLPMASLIFELEHGDLEARSRYLAQRLKSLGLAEGLRLPLALNQLDLGAPAGWLAPPDLEKLERIDRDADLRLLEPDLSRPGLVRLTHPLLAEALIRALVPDPSAPPASSFGPSRKPSTLKTRFGS